MPCYVLYVTVFFFTPRRDQGLPHAVVDGAGHTRWFGVACASRPLFSHGATNSFSTWPAGCVYSSLELLPAPYYTAQGPPQSSHLQSMSALDESLMKKGAHPELDEDDDEDDDDDDDM